MKRHEILLDAYESAEIFAPVRHRRDTIEILMRAIKLFLLNAPPPKEHAQGSMVLCVSKMSRLFFISDTKIFSINFPFNVLEQHGQLRFYSGSGYDIDHGLTSGILEILNTSIVSSTDAFGFIEPIVEVAEHSPDIWMMFRDLILGEDGYLRYDYDKEHENGNRHPLHHLDIFYTSNSTFKVGLDQAMKIDDLYDVLDSESDCRFLRIF